MRRTLKYWYSKYFIEGITLDEFWECLRPKGGVANGKLALRNLKNGRFHSVTTACRDFPMKLRVYFPTAQAMCFPLDQKIKLTEEGLLVQADESWGGGSYLFMFENEIRLKPWES